METKEQGEQKETENTVVYAQYMNIIFNPDEICSGMANGRVLAAQLLHTEFRS